MRRLHSHPCTHAAAGCTIQIPCAGLPDGDDPEGCTDALRFGELECPECVASRCAECGCIVRLEGHDKPCPNDPNYDPTPWELPGDGASTGPESRDAEAWNIKRGR